MVEKDQKFRKYIPEFKEKILIEYLDGVSAAQFPCLFAGKKTTISL